MVVKNMDYSHILSVLIADDELPIREELRSFDWSSCGAVLIGEASNGKEVLDFLENQVPDVLIADITMPIIDGITLLSVCREKYPGVQTVLLTCHSRFDYAQKALQLGAIGYIIKVTMSGADIREVLQKARSNLEREGAVKSYNQYRIRLKQSETINTVLASPERTVVSVGEILGVGERFCFERICVHCKAQDWIFIDRELRAIFESRTNQPVWLPVKVGEYLIAFGKNDSPDSVDRIPGDTAPVSQMLTETEQRLKNNLPFVTSDIFLYALVSGTVSGSEEFANEYKRLDGWIKLMFYEPAGKCFEGEPERPGELTQDMKHEILEKVKVLGVDDGKISDFIKGDYFRWAVENKLDPDEFRKFSFGLTVMLTGILPGEVSEQEIAEKLLNCDSAGAVISMMVYFVGAACRLDSSYQIKKAKQIIDERLRGSITLRTVSEEIGISPNYFSRIFAEQVGESFTDYVTRRRMEKAINLLNSSGLMVYEIAEEVGIPNYRYFSSVFKNWTGHTPKEYRSR